MGRSLGIVGVTLIAGSCLGQGFTAVGRIGPSNSSVAMSISSDGTTVVGPTTLTERGGGTQDRG